MFCVNYCEDAQNREPEEFKPLHFVAMPVKDTPEDAEKAEQDVICLAAMVWNMKRCPMFALRKKAFILWHMPLPLCMYVSIHPLAAFFFVSQLEETNDLEVDAASIVEKFEEETRRSLLHQVCHI